jgi:DNA-binding LytR/AlgR family response regulator
MGIENKLANGCRKERVSDAVYVKQLNDVGRVRIRYDEILHIKADGNHCEIYLVTRKDPITVARHIGDIEADLRPMGIVRVGRSEMVNVKYVREYTNSALILDNEDIIFVSDSYHDEVFGLFKEL